MAGRVNSRDPWGGGDDSSGSLIILEPQKWVGKPLPLLADLDIAGRLQAGRWIVVLYHQGCSTCIEALPGYEAMSLARQVALVEMPPYASPADRLIGPGSKAVVRKLSDTKEWFATTPVVLLMQDGVVRDVLEGKAAVGAGVDWEAMKLSAGPGGR